MSSNKEKTATKESEILFTLHKKQSLLKTGDFAELNEGNDATDTNNQVDVEEGADPDSILCIIWKNGKMGAAHYKISDQQLYVLQETIDLPPDFLATRSLYKEINPFHSITMGSRCDQFVKCLVNLANNEHNNDNNSSMSSAQTATLPRNITLLHVKECSFEACEHKISTINLASEPQNATNAEKTIFLHSLIDFDCKLSVHALGALIKFTEKNWALLNIDSQLKFLHINQYSLANRVFIDTNTFNGLHIFQRRSHHSNFQHGRSTSKDEGHSIYKLLGQYCKSKLGTVCLKNILMNPIKDTAELNKRLDFVEFAMVPSNQGFVEGFQESAKVISDVNTTLRKIQYSKATSLDWEMLHKTILHILLLHRLCEQFTASSNIVEWFVTNISDELYGLHNLIYKTFDFTNHKRARPMIKFGLDPDLDAKELQKQDISKNITAAAQFAVNQLPDYLDECSVVHIPEMGHLVAIKEWDPHCNPNQLEESGFQFVFKVKDLLHYKNPMCLELDKQLGNIYHEILVHENRVVQRLSDVVLHCNKNIREPLKIIGLMDCLISMSKVANEQEYVRPQLNQDNVHEIEAGRHPLLHLSMSDFVPNDYYSGKNHTHMKIITGPNNSGKSVYLKQNALIIFLGHVGSYVPAKEANIAMIHSIHSRIHATESAGVGLSSFMLDLSQMAQALHNAKSTSLVIVDEFGRGTTGHDGTALLVAALQSFLNQEEFCPHILVSTHIQQITRFLPQSKLVSHLKTDHTRCNKGSLVFLYKVVEGVSNSFAFEAAAAAGFEDIIGRAKEIYNSLYTDSNDSLIPNNASPSPRMLQYLSNINIPEPDD